MSWRSHDRDGPRTFGITPLPRGPFGPVTVHAQTSAALIERDAAAHRAGRA